MDFKLLSSISREFFRFIFYFVIFVYSFNFIFILIIVTTLEKLISAINVKLR